MANIICLYIFFYLNFRILIKIMWTQSSVTQATMTNLSKGLFIMVEVDTGNAALLNLGVETWSPLCNPQLTHRTIGSHFFFSNPDSYTSGTLQLVRTAVFYPVDINSSTHKFAGVVDDRGRHGARSLRVPDLVWNLVALGQSVNEVLLVLHQPQPHVDLQLALDRPTTRPHSFFTW